MREPDDPSSGSRDDLLRGIPEALRRAFSAGLPKEAVDYLRSQAHHTKEEAARLMAKEVREFLERADLADLARRVLANLKLEIKAEVKFVPTDGGVKVEATKKRRDEDKP
jgi:hypothetical protein